MRNDDPVEPRHPPTGSNTEPRVLLEALAAGLSIDELLLRYPDLTPGAVLEALAAGAKALDAGDTKDCALSARILDALPVNVFAKDAEDRFVYVNREAERTIGASRHDVIGKTDFEVFPEPVAANLRAADEAVRSTGAPTEADEHITRDGELRVWRAFKMLLPAQSARGPYLLGFSFDITEQRRAEDQLRRSEHRYATLLESTAVGALVIERAGTCLTYANDAAATLFGRPRAELLGLRVSDIHPEGSHPDIRAAIEERFHGAREIARDIPCLRPDGSVIYADVAATPVEVDGRESLLAFFFDATDRRRVEDTLRDQQRFLDLVLDTDPNCIYVKDQRGRYLLVNRALSILLGRPKAEIVGKTSQDLGCQPDEVETFAQSDLLVAGKRRTLIAPNKFTQPDGSFGWFETTKAPLVVDETTVHVLGISREVTEQKRSEEALEAREQELVERRRDLEELTYVSSHDLQEPLRKIRLFGERVVDRCGDQLDPKGRDYLGRMMEAAARMHRLIEDLLLFSRVSRGVDVRFAAVRPNEVLRAVVRDLEVQFDEAGAELDIGPLPELEADRSQLHRLFLNLVANALKYRQPDRRQRITIRGALVGSHGERWQATVADRGIGFDNTFHEKIFGMFQRLHGRTEYSGSGIGLAVCRRVAEFHGGTIEASGRPGEGAVFTVTLPVAQRARPDQPFGPTEARAEEDSRLELPALTTASCL